MDIRVYHAIQRLSGQLLETGLTLQCPPNPTMIPYYPQPVLEIAGTKFYAFGALVALALIVGCWVFLRRVRQQHLDSQFAKIFIVAVAGVGYFASYALKIIIFMPQRFFREPVASLNTGPGIYSFGGLVGGLLTAAWLMRRFQISPQDRWRYLDNLTFAFTCGWIFGRTGCSLAHDHVGILSNSPLAVRFPGGSRYDLGLLELIFTVLLAALFFFLDRQRRPAGLYFGLFFFTYGVFRIWRDTLEMDQPQLWGWSADGLFAVTCLLAGGFVLAMLYRSSSIYFFLICSAAIFLATSSASAAGTFTSGSTPVPSQLVFEIGLTARANGTPIEK